MNVNHTLGLLLYFNPTNQKYWARRFKRTKKGAKWPEDAAFETPVEVTSNFNFSVEMSGEDDSGDLSLEASGWGEQYDPPTDIELGVASLVTEMAPSLENWTTATAKPVRQVDFTFVMHAGGKGQVHWSIPGGSSGIRPFRGGLSNKAYGVLITLRYEKQNKARLTLKGSPWGNDTHDHP